MVRTIQIEIRESTEELRKLLRRQRLAKRKERVQALYLLKSGQVGTLEALSRMLGRNTSTLYRWFQKYRSEGLEGFLKLYTPAGKPCSIPPDVLEKLKQQLKRPRRFSKYGEIQSWLKEECGIEVDYHVVYRAVRHKLNVKLSTV